MVWIFEASIALEWKLEEVAVKFREQTEMPKDQPWARDLKKKE